jgi:hypothetical protein
MEFSIVTVVDCIMVSFAVYIFFSLQNYRRRTGYPYPPGPRPWPIIGNMLDIPSRLPGVAYADMSKQYGISHIPMALSGQLLRGFSGDVMSLQLLGQVVVILSSSSAIKDLLERRGEVYSDRPVFRLHQVYEQSKTLSFVLSHAYDHFKTQDRNGLALARSSQG